MQPDTTLAAAYWTPISALEKWRKNPRRNDKAVPRVARSIRTFGFTAPVIVWQSRGRLVAGHARIAALESILREEPTFVPRDAPGVALVPTRFVEFTDEAEASAYAIADNKLSEIAEWDEVALAEVLAEIRALDEKLLLETGFDSAEIDRLIREASGTDTVGEDPGPTEPPLNPVSRLGQIYQLGPHRLMCGDSTKQDDVLLLMNGERAVLCATDPPYLVDYDGTNHPQSFERAQAGKDNNKHWDRYRDPKASVEFFSSFIRLAIKYALVENPAFYQWHASKRQSLVEAAWADNALLLHQQLVWVKSRPILTRSHFMWQHEPCFYGWIEGRPPALRPPVGGECTTIWMIDQQGEQDGIHPTQKPLAIFERPISYHTGKGDLVYEPFSG
jgi:DNA modification methylase